MDIVAWILSGLVAVAFIGAGAMKLATPRAKLLENPQMAWAGDFSQPQIRAIGGLEVLGGLGVVLPWLLDVAPVLTPIAATGLALTMLGAMTVHARRGEKASLPPNAVLLALAAAVAIIRFAQL